MKKSSEKSQRKKKVYEVTTFPVPFTLGENQGNVTITTNHASNSSKEQIINQAIKFHLKGNITEAIKYYKYCLNQGINDHKVFSNYGTILKDLGKLHEAESFLRKAIALNPNFADGLSNLGTVLKDLGKLHEAESSLRKCLFKSGSCIERSWEIA